MLYPGSLTVRVLSIVPRYFSLRHVLLSPTDRNKS